MIMSFYFKGTDAATDAMISALEESFKNDEVSPKNVDAVETRAYSIARVSGEDYFSKENIAVAVDYVSSHMGLQDIDID